LNGYDSVPFIGKLTERLSTDDTDVHRFKKQVDIQHTPLGHDEATGHAGGNNDPISE
jgi:hypothetical protein